MCWRMMPSPLPLPSPPHPFPPPPFPSAHRACITDAGQTLEIQTKIASDFVHPVSTTPRFAECRASPNVSNIIYTYINKYMYTYMCIHIYIYIYTTYTYIAYIMVQRM